MSADLVRPADALWWQVFPLGFTGTEPTLTPTLTHRLPHVTAWLDYLVETGCNGLALGPVFAASTHGYDTVDHLRIDPRLGDRADFDALIATAHHRGVRVLLDGVFNHVGEQHPLFRAVLTAGPEHPDNALFRIDWSGDRPTWDCFEGHRHLVTLNHSSARVVDWVAEVMIHWLDAGADGWRLDAAYAVPTEFWAQVTARVRARHPDAYLLGEVIHGDYTGFVADSGVDTVTQYELWKAVWSSIIDHNWHELVWTLGRHDEFGAGFRPWTFIGNHDVTRIVTQVGGPRTAGHALVLLTTLRGTPAVYYGDEQAMPGLKEERAGGDDAIRPAYPPSPAEIPAEGMAPGGAALRRLHQLLLGLRHRHPWLADASTQVLRVSGELLVYRQHGAEGQTMTVALNLGEAETVPMGAGEVLAVSAPDESPGHGDPAAVALHDGEATVPARGWLIAH
ncbi:alpha-amylase family glycosyl hydrolase [Cellulomonas sp. NPDC089187]|uniref:alpha-amylase family glycosyl hydrolase n=1 Tax=Cellulomonas sp. NPDC089187 TaxID=3154970 RepID=UPI0034158F89